jgi:anti-sigma factor ChrR (cupin superfamily)
MKTMPSCHDVQAALTEYAEGTLPITHRVGIWIHLLLCSVCAGFLRGLMALPWVTKKSLVPPEVVPDAAAKAMSEVLAALRNRQ